MNTRTKSYSSPPVHHNQQSEVEQRPVRTREPPAGATAAPRSEAKDTRRAPPATRPRAQGAASIPWPPGMVDERDNCMVALRVRVTQAAADGELTLVEDLPRIGCGRALPTLQDLIAYRFDDAAREVLNHEVREIGWIDPSCPLALERVTHAEPYRVFVEILILPFGMSEAAELTTITRTEKDPSLRHRKGWEYAQALKQRWEQQAPNGEIPRLYLDVDFQVVRAEDAPQRRGTSELAPARRPALPIVI